MELTLKDIRLARKRAYDRVDYWLHKNWGMSIKELGARVPPVPKDLKPSEYNAWYNYYYNMRGNEVSSNIGRQLYYGWEPPEREEVGPTPVDPLEVLYSRIKDINPQAEEYMRSKLNSLANLIHDSSGGTGENIIANMINLHWDLFKDIEVAAYYMLSNYYGGLQLLDRALSSLFSLLGYNYIKFNEQIFHSAPPLYPTPYYDDIVDESANPSDVETVVIPLRKLTRQRRDELNED